LNNEPGHVGPRIDPGWLDVARQIIMFLLGVFLIVYSAMTSGHDIPFLLTGLALFGMIPVERALLHKERRNHDPRHHD
jgi:hypothetical protein